MWKLLNDNKKFRRFWIANAISSLGDYIDDVAFAQLVYLTTDSTLLTSYVFAVKILLSFLSIFTATYIDRVKKKAVIIFTAVGQAVVLLLLITLYNTNLLSILNLIIIVTVQSMFSTFSVPAQNAILPALVSKEELISARSSYNVSSQLIQIFGYIVSGVIINYTGINGAIAIDIITFGFAACIISSVNIPEQNFPNFRSATEFWSDVKNGFRFVLGSRGILVILVATLCGNMLTAPVQSLMPAYFSQGQYEDTAYSVFMICIACGGIIGSCMLDKLKSKLKNDCLFALGFIIGAIGMIILGLDFYIFPCCAAVAIGVSFGVVSIMNATMLQNETPRNMLARVFSIFRFISFFAGPLGMVLAGAVGEYVAMRWIMLLFGVILVGETVLTMNFFPKKPRV